GLSFSLDELQVGQEVDIYGYPQGIINPVRTLTRFPATFKAYTTSGLLAFDYNLSAGKQLRVRGASGGIVVDRKTEKIVGVLNALSETTTVSFPIKPLADFVRKLQPSLAQRLFPPANEVSPVSTDFYPKFIPPPDFYPKFVPTATHALEHRRQEPREVMVLR